MKFYEHKGGGVVKGRLNPAQSLEDYDNPRTSDLVLIPFSDFVF